MVVFPLTPPGVVYANFQPIKMPNPLAQSVNNNYNNLTRASSFSSRPPVGVASQMLHEQDAIVEDTVYGRSYWLARCYDLTSWLGETEVSGGQSRGYSVRS